MNQKLDPCPFCGRQASPQTGPPFVASDVARAWVQCDSCLARGPSVSSDVSEEEAQILAVTLWNRRKDHHGYTIDNEAGDDDPAGWS